MTAESCFRANQGRAQGTLQPLPAMPAHLPGEVSRALGGDECVHRWHTLFILGVCNAGSKQQERQPQAGQWPGRATAQHHGAFRSATCVDQNGTVDLGRKQKGSARCVRCFRRRLLQASKRATQARLSCAWIESFSKRKWGRPGGQKPCAPAGL